MPEHNLNAITGFLLINKPAGMTSRDCVNKIQRLLPKRTKIGHAGTLDRFATGLLIIGISRPATRLFAELMELDKVYEATAKLGELTDTLDYTGNLLQSGIVHISHEQLEAAIAHFPKQYDQTPPAYSALKWQGKRLSDIARSADQAHMLDAIIAGKKREIHLYDLALLDYKSPFFTFRAHVSHGTYIRALANDIAACCDTVATTHELKRVAIGPFKLHDAIPLDSVTDIEMIKQSLISVDNAETAYANYRLLSSV